MSPNRESDASGAQPDEPDQPGTTETPPAPRSSRWPAGEPDQGTTETAPFGEVTPTALPQRIGRYRVEKLLGRGGYGLVYLAQDEQLNRPVAVKVPHARLVSRLEDAKPYLTEARTVANLDHPNIVAVYDVGSTDEFPVYVVCKYVDGINLAAKIEQTRLPLVESADLVRIVAEALHHAHLHGLVHRDVKPGNILLDANGKPVVADFGVALREQDVGEGLRYAGTAAYMSPEQARGEGHRVDGRSDIFSLGIVFYELLTGRRPFRSTNRAELLEQIISADPRPPRQIDDAIPKELERICLRALAKRAAERYCTAKDMADDLAHFLTESLANLSSTVPATGAPLTSSEPRPATETVHAAPLSEPGLVRIVPKGLRSFGAEDADFFLELVPGPRDRDGLPDGIRFWKQCVEELDGDKTFPVGVMYGPSGCGKSSLVKAGLLPRLANHVVVVYVEATAGETESRLLRGIRKRCPDLPDSLGLKDTLAALRRGEGIPPGKKVLIVLDQFEQWLHATKAEASAELVHALRQCDGGRVQCVVMVRDDFWLAVSRFTHALEIRLLEGHNSALVDLFDTDHARKVLAAYGRAYGRLPDGASQLSGEQKTFLNKAVEELSEDGKVICVRLALFAEMLKGKPWTPATLKEVGGTAGVGVTFLEETFSASTAPPEHRYHQKAARAVLRALLSESATQIRGLMRSGEELLEASGYASRPSAFADLIQILDGELRLITPTDPEGTEAAEDAVSPAKPGQNYYQLTHDYLVPSLWEWQTRKQKETRRGRAELRLAEHASLWNARPENRYLPVLWKYLNIRLFTDRRRWTDQQRKMMARAGRHHALRGLGLGAILLVLAACGLTIRSRLIEQSKASYAASLVERVLDAHIAQVPGVIADMEGYRFWTDPLLREKWLQASGDDRQKLHASLALLPVEPAQVEYAYQRLLNAEPQEVPVIRDALAIYKDRLTEKLWQVAEKPAEGYHSQRLRAASALAAYDPGSARWETVKAPVAADLVQVPAVYVATWMECLQPVRSKLIKPLADIFRDRERRETERSLATDILAEYAADQVDVLADLLTDADEKQFGVLFAKLDQHAARAAPPLLGEIEKQREVMAEDDKELLAKRQANAAAALLRMGKPEKVWPLLKHSPDPRLRTNLIHRLAPLGVDAGALVKRLQEEPDASARRALILSLGQYDAAALGKDQGLVDRLLALYADDPDPGIHGAAGWLLRRWGKAEPLQGIDKQLPAGKRSGRRQWYLTSQGQTMVVVPGPVEFVMGSPLIEAGRSGDEALHSRRIGRTLAIAATEVTVEQFQRFLRQTPGIQHSYSQHYAPEPACPQTAVTWYEAAAYCRWLSEKEGIDEKQMCYPAIAQIKEGMSLPKDYLQRTGYRLPTEAEWEYACRAGSATSRYFGESEQWLAQYGWYVATSIDRSRPVASLKPNDLGLFDLLGNALEWCQDRPLPYPVDQGPKAMDDVEDTQSVQNSAGRVLRGGGFQSQPGDLRSAYRNATEPVSRTADVGFRPARTLEVEKQ